MAPKAKKLTPVLVVERVEDSLPVWCDRLGFVRTAEVPHGDALGFVILANGATELMIQSRASVAADLPALARDPAGSSLFVEVEDLAAVRDAVRDLEPLFEERTTFYGAREIGVRDPAGNAVVLAQFGAG